MEELKHYGVLGMKWGHRKSSSVSSANKAYKSASKELREAKRKKLFSASSYLAGSKNVKLNKQMKAKIERLKKNKEKAAFKLIDAKAKYEYDKTYSKTGNKAASEKASMKVHAKAFGKNKGGLPGSINDAETGGESTRYYNHMKVSKGKKYADAVEKKYRNKTFAAAGVATAISVGMMVSTIYELNR